MFISESSMVHVIQNKTNEGSIMLENCNSSIENMNWVINNFIISKNASCIAFSNCTNTYCLNNSTYLYGTVEYRGALFSYNSYNLIARNNIFASFGSGCVYSIDAGLINTDYNAVYTNNNITRDDDVYIFGFTSWVNTSGNDTYSIEIEPDYVSNLDLHIFQSELDGMALPFAFVDKDIDDEYRNPLAPDIGADEFNFVVFSSVLMNKEEIVVFPNPVNQVFYISMTFNVSKSINVELLDVQGDLISEMSKLPIENGENIFKIELKEQIEAGVYFLRITTNNKTYLKKIIKNK